MSQQLLGDSFDMHTGGVDNVFPHHEDEIAQSEAATGKPFVRYWLHCAHLIVDGRKMSKSLGNFHTLRDLLARGFTGREIRYVLLACHYRQALNFTFDALHAARAALARVDEFTTRLRELAGSAAAAPLPAWAAAAHTTFRAGLEEDLNISAALAALFDMLTLGNRQCDAGAVTPGAAAAVLALLADWDRVLGLLQAGAAAVDATVQGLLDQRAAARQAKDWATSDRLRQELAALGWDVRDGADGQKVRKR
jgi:cysteinyl-tRNA synthetase